ncbi:DUF2971 domain-containing protein [Acidovorax sp. SRB_24]|uniref:DUF2971 domain-containing protein n=1 Tax=Acidovorax sp. SRB_24 TaxID=1962700 RepID=UPI00145FB05B|nr:DUF2971 domain-containing protein [Acidovorax sp. SRB_24]NMM77752.1 hypothetical protein [Acidovorax sp. SRB_24]
MLPPRLYKYEPFTTRSLENLKAQSIYFGPPSAFNDPYDCAFVPNIRRPTNDEVEAIRAAYLRAPETPPIARAQFEGTGTDELREILLRSARSALESSVKAFLARRGVTCFSEQCDDLLMWSHYGGRYQGFCLEFDPAKGNFGRIQKVAYSNELPLLDLVPLLASDNYEQVLSLFTTKAEAWRYEAEWRAVHAEAGTLYGYPSECLEGVYFGPDISDHALEIVCLILKGQNETVRFWKGRRSSTTFKVEFESFTYMSYMEARKAGLR